MSVTMSLMFQYMKNYIITILLFTTSTHTISWKKNKSIPLCPPKRNGELHCLHLKTVSNQYRPWNYSKTVLCVINLRFYITCV